MRKGFSVRRKIQQLLRRRRRLAPPNFRKWSERLERGRSSGSRSRRCGRTLSKRSRRYNRRLDLLNGRIRLTRSPIVTLRMIPTMLRRMRRSHPIRRVRSRRTCVVRNDRRVDRRRDIPIRDVKASVLRRHRNRHRRIALLIGWSLVGSIHVQRRGLLTSRADIGAIPNVLASVTVPSRAKPVPFPLPPRHIERRKSGPGSGV